MENQIALRFLQLWSGAGGSGRRSAGAAGEPRPLFVDVPAGGPPGGLPDARRPWMRELAAALAPLMEPGAAGDAIPGAGALLVQDDPALLDALEEEVRERGLDHLLGRGSGADPLPDEPSAGITLLAGDLVAAAPRILREIMLASRALVRIAVFRPAELPFATACALAERPHADLLLRLPLEELHRLDRYRTTPVADLPLALRRFAEGVSVLLGDARFEWLPRFRSAAVAEGVETATAAVAERFRGALAERAPNAIVRRIPLPPPGGVGAAVPLILATHGAERVLQMNRILHELRADGRLPWEDAADPLVRMERPGVIDLFGGEAAPPAPGTAGSAGPRIRSVDHVGLANLVAERFADRAATLEEVMRCAAERDLFPEDVRRALRLLRRDRRARFRTLTAPEDVVHFGEADADAAPGSRRRKGRGAGEPGFW